MGTRNLTCVVKNGEYKVAQYGQWDGYPEGQGITILNYLNKWNRNKFEESLETVNKITEEQYKKCWESVGVYSTDGFVEPYESDKFKEAYPYLNRNMAGEILEYIENNKNLKLSLYKEFANDSLFCEWAYVVDLDKNTFEVYQGFNKNPLDKDERFYSDELKKHSDDCPQYHPVKFLISFDLDKLPREDEFLKVLEEIIGYEEE